MSENICFVVQRYGLEVNGGAELLCRLFAEHMKNLYKIEVLTTKAIEYQTWKDEYESDVDEINGITVRRFGVEHERGPNFDEINAEFMTNGLSPESEQDWIDRQGPYVPKLVSYLIEHQYDYKVVIFFTYLYYPTVMGIKALSNKTIVMPFAHDEPFLRMKIFDDVFLRPSGIVYSTDEEKKLINAKYHNEYVKSTLGGSGVDLPDIIDGERFKKKYGLENYIVYVGRIDEGKKCGEMFSFFSKFKERNHNGIKLVLMGKPVMEIPLNLDVISLGFVSDEDKFDGIAGANALWLPSKFESLSMVVLEAMAVRTNVIVNGECEVLKGHCLKSNGAFYYNDYFEFEGELNYLLNPVNAETVDQMKENAKLYVDENYQWNAIIQRLHGLIENVSG